MKHDMAIFEEEMGDMIDRTGLPRPPEKGANISYILVTIIYLT